MLDYSWVSASMQDVAFEDLLGAMDDRGNQRDLC